MQDDTKINDSFGGFVSHNVTTPADSSYPTLWSVDLKSMALGSLDVDGPSNYSDTAFLCSECPYIYLEN